jgi:hypothetical protein
MVVKKVEQNAWFVESFRLFWRQKLVRDRLFVKVDCRDLQVVAHYSAAMEEVKSSGGEHTMQTTISTNRIHTGQIKRSL